MKIRYACVLCAGWLAAIASAPADIVWSGEQNLYVYDISQGSQNIDLNSDSLVDASFSYIIMGDTSGDDGTLLAFGQGNNGILADLSSDYMAALPFSTLISDSPNSPLEWGVGGYSSGRVSYWSTHVQVPGSPPDPNEAWRGPLGENGNTYVGIEFAVGETNHFGWVNIALGSEGYLGFETPIITSWAYETSPNTAIVAGAIPEPSTGILTMVGSLSLLMLARSRRREKQGCDTMPRCRAPKAPATPEEW